MFRFHHSLLVLVSTLILPAAVFARDSEWLLGDNGHVAVNILEHREGMGRATDIVLIYGSHFLHGTLTDTNAGKVVLKEAGKSGYVFTGTVGVDYDTKQITLQGKLGDADAQHTVIATYDTKIKGKVLEADQ